MPFSYDTMITVSNARLTRQGQGTKKAIQDFAPGDPVWVAEHADLKTWIHKPVRFSSGNGGKGRIRVINITFEDDKGTNNILVTTDQPFLMPDKTLKRAEKFVPGKDVLLMENGKTCSIFSVQLGIFENGIHDIATSSTPTASLDGHLLIANGIVAGDYALSLGMRSGLFESAD